MRQPAQSATMAPMNILITGGAGFIGSHVAEAYLAQGHRVVILDDLSTGREANIPPAATFHQVDLRDEAALTLVRELRPDVISHHAAQMNVRRAVDDPVHDLHVNLVATVRLLAVAREVGVRKFIYASSGGTVYGEQQSFPAGEDHPTHPISPYGIDKLAAEQYTVYMAHGAFQPVILRYANVYGHRQNPAGEAGVVAIFAQRLLAGKACTIYGDGQQTRDYLYIGDAVEANLLVLRDEAEGVYNVGTGKETPLLTLYAAIADQLAPDTPPQHVPAGRGELRRNAIAPARLREQFGWVPQVGLGEGLAETLGYLGGKRGRGRGVSAVSRPWPSRGATA